MSSAAASLKSPSVTIPIPTREDGWKPKGPEIAMTPGGTFFAFTPGGSRIIYDREALLMLSHSPLSKSAPLSLPKIPGVTAPQGDEEEDEIPLPLLKDKKKEVDSDPVGEEEEQLFHLEEN
eukprot:TRINITY_DN181_c0_g1_i4.p1 TRINITY_DN181_c0_g1~~TRINITY_DN181_c0_g1_i4.p1  ORF type:complete len:121 (-),score=24.92 TRINITY_DN181_c0_g1_i4:165-527(-)